SQAGSSQRGLRRAACALRAHERRDFRASDAAHRGSRVRLRRGAGRLPASRGCEPLRQSGDPALSAAMTVRAAVISLLREFGLTTVFGNPGSTELPMFRDFPADFRYVLGLQESIVVAMADGFAQAQSLPALVNLHSAIGVGHALGSIFTAYKNQTPL